MSKINVETLLKQASELKALEKKQRAEMKARKQIIAKEITSGISPEQKQEQIERAKELLATATAEKQKARETFKQAMVSIQEKTNVAKALLSLVAHEQSNGLSKTKNAIEIDGNIATIQREGIKNVSVDVTKNDWQKTLKAKMETQEIGNGIARNVAYKVSKMLKAR